MTNTEPITNHALSLLRNERIHQIHMWGNDHDETHTAVEWVAILTRLLGEAVVEAVNELGQEARPNNVRWERKLTQVAATCIAAIEAQRRNYERWLEQATEGYFEAPGR